MKRTLISTFQDRILYGKTPESAAQPDVKPFWRGKIPYPLLVPFSITSFLVAGSAAYAAIPM